MNIPNIRLLNQQLLNPLFREPKELVSWMGAASGNDCCIANVLRLAMRYGNLPALEDGYGINLLPLATFAMEAYANDPCEYFAPKIAPESTFW